MKVLLDVGVSHRLRRPLQETLDGAPVESAIFRGWQELKDDELLARAHADEFTALLTTDKRLAQEQASLALAVIALDDNRLPISARLSSESQTPFGKSETASIALYPSATNRDFTRP